MAALCRAVAPLRVVIAGRTESALEPIPNAIDLLNRTTIPELIWLIRRAAFVVSVDSGPMHIASALTGNLLGIHTWSDPRLVGPYNPEAWVWKNGAIMQVKSLEARRLRGSKNFEIEDTSGVAEFLKTRPNCLA